jgi:hypothetical protein
MTDSAKHADRDALAKVLFEVANERLSALGYAVEARPWTDDERHVTLAVADAALAWFAEREQRTRAQMVEVRKDAPDAR